MRIYPTMTQDAEFAALRALGYTGSLNDMQYKFLGDSGWTGALPDRINLSGIALEAYWNEDFLSTGTWDTSGIWRDAIPMKSNDFLATGTWNRAGVWREDLPTLVSERLADIGSGQVILAFAGDSWIQGDSYWLRQFTLAMQETYGNAGIGYVGFQWFGTSSGTWVDPGTQPSGGGAGCARGDLVSNPVFDGAWSSDNGGQPGGTAAPSIGYAETSAANAYVRFTVPAGHNAVDLFFVGTAAGGTVEYSWNDGSSWETAINVTGTDGVCEAVALSNVPGTAATLRLRRASGTIRLAGVNLKSATSGVVVHKLGASGSNSSQWAAVDLVEWAGHLTTLGAQFVGILLGTNDASSGTIPSVVASNAENLMAAIKAEDFSIERLWIMPAERSTGSPTTFPMTDYAEAVRIKALAGEFGFLNLQTSWGPDPDAYAFGEPGALMDSSNLHPATATGGLVTSNAVRAVIEP